MRRRGGRGRGEEAARAGRPAIKTGRKIQLRSRNDNDFSSKYPSIVKALASLPDETALGGELVAFYPSGRPSFNMLQNASSGTPIFYYLFDVLVLAGRNLMRETLDVRLGVLEAKVLPKLKEPVRHYPPLSGTLRELVKAVRAHGFEGVVAKRRDSLYEAGQRSGAWRKMRVNQGQEFAIGGYTPTVGSFDALIFGYYQGDQLMYVGRTRNGFTPRSRLDLLRQLQRLETPTCPFALLVRSRATETPQGQVPLKPRHHRLFDVGRSQELPGSWGIHPIPLPRSRIPAGLMSLTLCGSQSAVPTICTMRTPAVT